MLDDYPGSLDWPPEGALYRDDDIALVTVAEAAELVGVSESAVRDWRKRELIFPADWMGRNALYSAREIIETEYDVRMSGRGRPRLS